MMLQRSFLYSDLMLNKRIIIVKNIIFSQDCLMNREFKMTAVYCILAESFKFFQIYFYDPKILNANLVLTSGILYRI